MGRVGRSARVLFARRRPWRIHFFNETLDRSDVGVVPAALLRGEEGRARLVGEFERSAAARVGGDGEMVTFGGGRMALWALLEALGIGRGDEVVVPAFTCEVVPLALLYRGIVPRYADIETVSFGADPSSVEALVGPRTKAVIAQHSFGAAGRIEDILAVADRAGVPVIEDCAISLGSLHRGRPLGSFGAASFFSWDRTKVISTILGGGAFSRDSGIVRRLREIQHHSPDAGAVRTFNLGLQVLASTVLHSPYAYPVGRPLMGMAYRSGLFYDIEEDREHFRRPRHYPCRYPGVLAAVGISQLRKLDGILERRGETIRRIRAILEGNGIFVPRPETDFSLRFPLLLRDRAAFERKWDVYFELGKWFDSPAAPWKTRLDRIGYTVGSCPVAEGVHSTIANLPAFLPSDPMRRYLYEIVDTLRPEDLVT